MWRGTSASACTSSASSIGADHAARLAGGDGEAGKHGQLAGEGFGRGDADLWARQGRKNDIRFPRDGGFAHIHHRDDVLTLRAAIAQRRERIGGLARLRDEQCRAALRRARSRDSGTRRRYRHRPEAWPSARTNIWRRARHRRRCRRPRSRAGASLAKSKGSGGNVDAVGGEIDIAGERVADHLGLLVDLLRHEVAVVALVDEERVRLRSRHRPLDRIAVAVADGDARCASAPPSRRPRDRRWRR